MHNVVQSKNIGICIDKETETDLMIYIRAQFHYINCCFVVSLVCIRYVCLPNHLENRDFGRKVISGNEESIRILKNWDSSITSAFVARKLSHFHTKI